jgi:DNA-binding NtrC family response regulator
MKPHVLILDDEAAIGRSLSRTLRQAGFDVTAQDDVDEALRLLKTVKFSVVVSDQRMPKMDGVTFLEHCASEQPSAVRILLTGYADAQVAAEAVNRAGVFRLLWKPWADSEIVEAIRQAAWLSGLDSVDEVTPVTELNPPLSAPKLVS